MNGITASQLRTQGVAIIEKQIAVDCEAVITVRGEEKFVVMDMQRYNHFRECELDAALHEVRAGYETGRLVAEGVEKHVERMTQ